MSHADGRTDGHGEASYRYRFDSVLTEGRAVSTMHCSTNKTLSKAKIE